MTRAVDFASTKYLQCRPLKSRLVIVWDIARQYNYLLSNSLIDENLELNSSVSELSDVFNFDFQNRHHLKAESAENLNDVSAHEEFRPCLVVQIDGHIPVLLDGISRLNELASRNAKFVRIITISHEVAIAYGRRNLDILDEEGQLIPLESEPAASLTTRFPIEGIFLRKARPKGIIRPNEVHPDASTAVCTVPTVATASHKGITINFLRPWPLAACKPGETSFDRTHIKYDPSFLKTGDSGPSHQDLVIVEFIISLFHAVELISSRIKPTRLAGHNIIKNLLWPIDGRPSERGRFMDASPGNISSRRKTTYLSESNVSRWRRLLHNWSETTRHNVDIALLKISLRYRHDRDPKNDQDLLYNCVICSSGLLFRTGALANGRAISVVFAR